MLLSLAVDSQRIRDSTHPLLSDVLCLFFPANCGIFYFFPKRRRGPSEEWMRKKFSTTWPSVSWSWVCWWVKSRQDVKSFGDEKPLHGVTTEERQYQRGRSPLSRVSEYWPLAEASTFFSKRP